MMELGMLHRPLFPGTRQEETIRRPAICLMDLDKESIWIGSRSSGTVKIKDSGRKAVSLPNFSQ
jgi:hypothetical protein